MFAVTASYVSLLQAVASRCRLPYVSFVHEVAHDGDHLYGVEVELPSVLSTASVRTLFFWSTKHSAAPLSPYDAAALQAVCCLQAIYRFVVLDYSFFRLVPHAVSAEVSMYPTANAVRLAKMIMSNVQDIACINPELVGQAQQLLQPLSAVNFPMHHLF